MNGRTNVKTWLAMAAIFLGLGCATAVGDIIYVDADATGANDGSSWANAFNHLQDALDDATSGDEIWVAGGVYEPDESFRYPNGTGSRNATFQLKNGVVIKGGYAGFGEPDPDARDIELYETILSGDLNGDDGPDFANNGENSYHVVTGNWTNATAVLDGFTITAGNAGFGGGGGMFSYYGSPTLTNCTFSGNSAEVGGGMLSWNNSNPTLTNCTFSDNSSGWIGGGMVNWDYSSPTLTGCTFNENWASEFGGGMLSYYNSSPTLTNCTFSGNSASFGGGGIYNWQSNPVLTNCMFNGNLAEDRGGGMNNDMESNPTLTNCAFSENSAGAWGGGLANWRSNPMLTNCTFTGNSVDNVGGGMSNYDNSSPTVTDCTFNGNSAGWSGGGVGNWDFSNPTLISCRFSGNWGKNDGGGMCNADYSSPTLVNCTFNGNSSDWWGGGMNNSNSSPTVGNCTFSRNSVANGGGGGMCNFWESSPTLTNCILWGNSGPQGSQIYNQGTSSATVSYSDVQGGWAGTGNIAADPCFVGPTYGGPIEGLISHWKFDEGGGTVAYDSAGDNHGTLVNGPVWTTSQVDGALSFDGGDDYVKVSDDASLDISQQITITLWLFQRHQSTHGGCGVTKETVYKFGPDKTPKYLLRMETTGGSWYDQFLRSNSATVLNKWTHIAATYDSAKNTSRIYINGILDIESTTAITGTIETNTAGLWIGRGLTPYFDGVVDDVRIYDRALSAEEIRQFYQMDYHLLPDSPCIDAGDNTAVPAGVTTDLDGARRFVDDPYTVDTGNGTPPIVDMGAYEHPRPPISIYVDEDAPGPIHDGLGWADAFNHLQDALAFAISGDEIRVAEGTYMPDSNSDEPDGTRNREATFQLINGVGLYGGYAGYGEPDPNERDPNTYETILSGDLNGDDGPDFANNAENSYHVVTGSGTDETAVLDGFIITGGNANGSLENRYGGGMYNYEGSPILTNCTFSGNSAGWSGGGMANGENSSPTLTNCTFSGNSAGMGGGMYNYTGSPTLTNCTFSGNSAGDYGSGMYNRNSSPTVTNCTFSGNWAYNGGGMANRDYSSPTLTNCTFSGNSAEDKGGGMWNQYSNRPTLTNCILWGNTAPNGSQIYNDGTSWATVSYSCVQEYVEPTEPPTQGLISYWRFDEGEGAIAYDSAGDNDGTLIGDLNWTNGIIDGALSFDGVVDYVDCGTGPAITGTGNFTVSAWVKVTELPASGALLVVVNQRSAHSANGSYLIDVLSSGRVHFEVYNSGYGFYFDSDVSVVDDSWHHIAGVRTSTTEGEIYIDGNLAGSGSGPAKSLSNFDVVIGRWNRGGHYFNGVIDDVRIYDTALSAEEVEQLYQYGLNQGNIDADPRFLYASGGDLRLLPTSPCIDAGDNTAVPAGVTTDLGGNLRFVDQPEVPDTGNGTAPIVDMGAFEADYIQAQMKFTPKVLNPKSKARWIKAHLVLPEGFVVEDVNTNSPAKIVEPFIADSNYMEVFLNEDGLVEIMAAFDRADFCSNGSAHRDIVVIAQLTTGQYFYGTDTIRIKTNNLEYLAVLTSHWLEADCGEPDWCGGADLNRDSVVDFIDFAFFDGCCIEVIEE